MENATTRTMQSFDSTVTAHVHYVKYTIGKKKSGRNYNSSATSTDKKCYRCGYSFELEHMKNCPAKDAECQFYGVTGHFAKCCGKAGKFPRDNKKENSTAHNKDSAERKAYLPYRLFKRIHVQLNTGMKMET